MNQFFKSWRVILIVSLYIQIFIFLGVFLLGIIDLFSAIIVIDYVYALLYIVLAFLAVFIFSSELRILHQKPISEKRLARWKRDFPKIIIATIVFIVLYVFRFELDSIIWFVGFEIGRFFIRAATTAYLNSFGFDLDVIQFYHLAWIFQWHFIFAVVNLAYAVVQKIMSFFTKTV